MKDCRSRQAEALLPLAITVGGVLGHVEEMIEGDLLTLWRYWEWKPIRDCTGRYTCREKRRPQVQDDGDMPTRLPPLEFLRVAVNQSDHRPNGNDPSYWQVREFGPARGRTDRILVLPLDADKRTGIITYVKESHDGEARYVHTLNAPSGFRRKLDAVGIQLE